MTTSKLWALIEEWRDAQLFPVSQAALATKIGVSRSAMSQWKAGQAKPSPEKLRQIASVTRIPYERLLSAVVQDLGYLDTEEVGLRGDAAPSTPAGGSPAQVVQFPTADPDPAPPAVDDAAARRGDKAPDPHDGAGEESQDTGDEGPR